MILLQMFLTHVNDMILVGGKVVSGLLTVSEVAYVLRVDVSTVRRWVTIGALKAVVLPRVGKRQVYRIPRETIDKMLDIDNIDRLIPNNSGD